MRSQLACEEVVTPKLALMFQHRSMKSRARCSLKDQGHLFLWYLSANINWSPSKLGENQLCGGFSCVAGFKDRELFCEGVIEASLVCRLLGDHCVFTG